MTTRSNHLAITYIRVEYKSSICRHSHHSPHRHAPKRATKFRIKLSCGTRTSGSTISPKVLSLSLHQHHHLLNPCHLLWWRFTSDSLIIHEELRPVSRDSFSYRGCGSAFALRYYLRLPKPMVDQRSQK